MMIPKALSEQIWEGFALDLGGIHGTAHWDRVRDNGLRLAEQTGARRQVIEYFAILHDSKRLNDMADRGHGPRAAEFARGLPRELFLLSDDDYELLLYAVECHSDGLLEAHVTVQTCWDADRLDLGRIGVMPRERFLCTAAARDPQVIEWALARSRA